jgi:hypothetical protein
VLEPDILIGILGAVVGFCFSQQSGIGNARVCEKMIGTESLKYKFF